MRYLGKCHVDMLLS